MNIKCDAITRKGRRCFVNVDVNIHPTKCHVHAPNGKFQEQVRKKALTNGLIKKRVKKKNITQHKVAIVAQMMSRMCRHRPYLNACYDPRGIHCDTIQEMIDIVLMSEIYRDNIKPSSLDEKMHLTNEEKEWISSWKAIRGS
jgi:hypothetical protein